MMPGMSNEPIPVLCCHCRQPIRCDREQYVFVVRKSSDPSGPFACQIQPGDFLLGDEELAFDSITCIKKWLLQWVDVAVAQNKKAVNA
jgi:hypothetical protein